MSRRARCQVYDYDVGRPCRQLVRWIFVGGRRVPGLFCEKHADDDTCLYCGKTAEGGSICDACRQQRNAKGGASRMRRAQLRAEVDAATDVEFVPPVRMPARKKRFEARQPRVPDVRPGLRRVIT